MEDRIMKNIVFILIVFLGCWGCQEDQLKNYDGEAGIYFARIGRFGTEFIDTTTFSFTFVNVADTVIRIPVRGYGQVSKFDRMFRIEVEGGTARAGENFDVLQEEYTLEADSIVSYIPIHIYREGALDTTLSINLHLLPNVDFTQNLELKKLSGDTLDITRHVVRFTDGLVEPEYWSMLNTPFNKARFYFFSELLEIEPAHWFTNPTQVRSKLTGGLIFVENYLNTFIDEDDYVHMPKDPEGPKGYMVFGHVEIPAFWPEASEI